LKGETSKLENILRRTRGKRRPKEKEKGIVGELVKFLALQGKSGNAFTSKDTGPPIKT